MKKIVGILAASAVLASSVFAADVAAKVKLTGSTGSKIIYKKFCQYNIIQRRREKC